MSAVSLGREDSQPGVQREVVIIMEQVQNDHLQGIVFVPSNDPSKCPVSCGLANLNNGGIK